MFKSLKKKSDKVKEKIDFKMSFHATRVPAQGWDKLVISVVPLETQRAVAKTPRAVVKNGNCQWPDSIIESTRLLHDNRTKEYEEKKYKFVVSSGSSRSGQLGDATINLGEFADSNLPQQRALPLKNCNTGTVLHVNVTCLTPRTSESAKELDRRVKLNNEVALTEEQADAPSDEENLDDSDKSGNTGPGNSGHLNSPRRPGLDSPPLSPTSSTRKLQQRSAERHVSQSALRYSSSSLDSLEVPSTSGINSFNENAQGFSGEHQFSPSSSFTSLPEKLERGGNFRESGSQESNQFSPTPSYGHKRTLSSSAATGGHQGRQDGSNLSNWGAHGEPVQGGGRHPTDAPDESTLRRHLEAAESTIEELRMEATTSLRHARKLSVDVQQLNHKLETAIRHGKEKEMELSTLMSERDGFKQEVEQLKSEKQDSQDRETGEDDARWAVEEAQRVIQELKEEMMFEKTTITNLNLQLRKTQDANMELVLELDDIEKAFEQHRRETDELKGDRNLEAPQPSDLNDLIAPVENEWAKKLAAKEEEIKELEAKLTGLQTKSSRYQATAFVPTGDSSDAHVNGLQSMLKVLQQDVEELEADTNRLTDENAELQAKLETMNTELSEKNELISELESNPASHVQSSRSISAQHCRHADLDSDNPEEGRAQLLGRIASLEGEVSRLKQETVQLLDERDETENLINRLQVEKQELQKTSRQLEPRHIDNFAKVNDQDRDVARGLLLQQLAETVTGLESELQESQEEARLSRLHIEELEREILTLTTSHGTVETSSVELETLKNLLEGEKKAKERILHTAEENDQVSQERLDCAIEELELLRTQADSLLSEKRDVEKRASELKMAKAALERQFTDLEEQNVQMADHTRGLEVQLKYITEERDAHQQEAGVVEDEKSRLRSERDELQAALNSTTAKHGELTMHLTNELGAAIEECQGYKSSHRDLKQEVMQLRGEIKEAKRVLQQHTADHSMAEESLQNVTRDHASAVAISSALEVQVTQLQVDLKEMEMTYDTEARKLKESKQHLAEKAEEALQHRAIFEKDNIALHKRVMELELVLEEQHKEDTLSTAEQNGEATSNGNRNELTRSPSISNNRDKSSTLDELSEKLRILEREVKSKTLELERLRQEYKQKESGLLCEIERLELANDQLLEGPPDSDLRQLQVELTRLQNHNAALGRRERELLSQLSTQEMLQNEVERLQEVNEKLDNRLIKYKAAATGVDMVEKVVTLETELAEATEANNMYKSQLRSAFAEPHNVHAAALQNFGDVDQVVSDLVGLRKRVKQLESELREMRDRYSTMSLRFAEVEAQREELVMTVRTLRSTKRQ